MKERDDELTEWSHHGRGGTDGTGIVCGLVVAVVVWTFFFMAVKG